MNENMISINSETKAIEYIPFSFRIDCYSNILSSVMMQRAGLLLDKTSLSSLDFEFLLPIYKEVQQNMEAKRSKKQNEKKKEALDEDTQFIIFLYESMDNKPNKKKQIKEKCLIEFNNSIENGIKTCKVDLPFLYAVNNIIISILNQSQKTSLITQINLIKSQKISLILDEYESEGKTSNIDYLKQLFNLTQLQFCFSNSDIDQCLIEEDKAKLYKAIIFFFYFFPFIFTKLTSVTIDFNIYQLLNYYRESRDPYSFFVHKMEEGGVTYDYLFLANFLSAMQLRELKQISALKIIFNESYIIESQSLIRSRDSIFYLELFHLSIEKEIDISFNSLDPLLFKRSIDLILINKDLLHLSMDFFPQKPANFRKMCYNALFYNRLVNENDQNFLNPESAEDQHIDYVHLKELTISDKSIISDDKLVKYVFKGFNSYLKQLTYALEIITETLESLNLRLNQYPELLFYDSYNSSVALFLYDLFLLLNYKLKDKNIERLSIECNAENYDSLISRIMKENQLTNKLGLDLPKLKYISLRLSNIRVYLSFSKFPFETIETLILNNVSFEDFTELVKALKVSGCKMTKANNIKISLNYSDAIDYDVIGDFFHYCLPVNIHWLRFQIPFSLSIEKVYHLIIKNMLLNTRSSDNNRINVALFVSIQEIMQFEGNKIAIANKALEFMIDYFKLKKIGDCKITLVNYYTFQFVFNRFGYQSNNNNNINYAICKVLGPLFENKLRDKGKRNSIIRHILYYVNLRQILLNLQIKKAK